MTYAATQVAYWVGQANDNSTGQHPPGYVASQRWSTTSNTWMTMYNTEYANARDTSTGVHPNGWTNGQFWSTTAGQWNGMYNTEYANARDTGGGQGSSGLGAQHPPGYGYGQFYSTTAEQWNAVWGTEWRNARDPQGYSFSYPGQPPNAVYWSQSAQYWRGQADYYWGPTRQWNNGSTWEQLYNLYVGYYNDMVNQRDTWAARANNAWGPSRAWNNGESWEAAYNRVLPANLWSQSGGNGAGWNVPYTGYYVLMTRADVIGGDNCGDSQGSLNIFVNGNGVCYTHWYDWCNAGAIYGPALFGAGTAVSSNGGAGRGFSSYRFVATFVPTPQYPH